MTLKKREDQTELTAPLNTQPYAVTTGTMKFCEVFSSVISEKKGRI